MVGKKQFDEYQAIDNAMRVFWQKGYTAASLTELTQATGLNKSSLYNTFKSKEHLYALCLQHFTENYTRQALKALEQPDFKATLSKLFNAFGSFDSPTFPNNCIATMAALEMGGKDENLNKVIRAGLTEVIDKFEWRIEQAIIDGEVAADTDAKSLASLMVAVTRGVIVLNKGTQDPDAGRRSYQTFMELLFKAA